MSRCFADFGEWPRCLSVFAKGDDIQNACEQLESTALEFNGKSGPRIDYKVIKTAIGYEIDPRFGYPFSHEF